MEKPTDYFEQLEMSALSFADSGKCDVLSLNNTLEKGTRVYALLNICAILPVMFFLSSILSSTFLNDL